MALSANQEKYINVVGFEASQHYASRNAPWIKLYKAQFKNPEFLALGLEARAVLIHLQIIAADYQNRIPVNMPFLRLRLAVDSDHDISLRGLMRAGFITITT